MISSRRVPQHGRDDTQQRDTKPTMATKCSLAEEVSRTRMLKIELLENIHSHYVNGWLAQPTASSSRVCVCARVSEKRLLHIVCIV